MGRQQTETGGKTMLSPCISRKNHYFHRKVIRIIAMAEQDEKIPTIAEDIVVTKYKMAAEIVNRVLKETVALCKAGASVRETCINADKRIEEETGNPLVHHAVAAGYADVSPSNAVNIAGLAPAAIPAVGGAYAGAGRYCANSAGVIHCA